MISKSDLEKYPKPDAVPLAFTKDVVSAGYVHRLYGATIFIIALGSNFVLILRIGWRSKALGHIFTVTKLS